MLGGSEAAIYQVIEADEVAAGVGAEGGTEDGTGEPADHGAKDEWPDWRARRHLNGGSVRFDRRINWLVDVSQHLLILPKPRRRSPSTHWMARRVGASAHRSSSR
jgi:hypothetical protein